MNFCSVRFLIAVDDMRQALVGFRPETDGFGRGQTSGYLSIGKKARVLEESKRPESVGDSGSFCLYERDKKA